MTYTAERAPHRRAEHGGHPLAPSNDRFLLIQGARVRLVDHGCGPPVLLLHGNPDSADLWAGVIARLSPRFRCLAPDLPGFGRSPAPDDLDRSPDGMARFIDGCGRRTT